MKSKWRRTERSGITSVSYLFSARPHINGHENARNERDRRIKIEEKYLITSGASAGLAAAFNAPLAGVMFALEEVHKNFSPLVLLSALSAAVSADIVTSEFFGLKPVLNFKSLTVLPLKYYFYIILLGVILGILAWLLTKRF